MHTVLRQKHSDWFYARNFGCYFFFFFFFFLLFLPALPGSVG
jgi:hypothetical protein